MKPKFEDLIDRHLAGLLTDAEAEELQSCLKAEADLRRLYLHHMNLDVALEAQAGSRGRVNDLLQTSLPTGANPASRWLSWRPLASAAAGMVVGLFGASMAFAYVMPLWGTITTLLDDGFESGPAPLAKGIPVEDGAWSGDYAEVVGEQQGVKPESGGKMLRLLRSDYEGKATPERGHLADIYRLIDMRSYRLETGDSERVVQCQADLNAALIRPMENYRAKLSIHALDAETATHGALWQPKVRIEADLATASTGQQRLDQDPETWQRLAVDLRLPADTDFLLIRVAVEARGNSLPKQEFEGHYLDSVRLTMRRSPLP